MKQKTVM